MRFLSLAVLSAISASTSTTAFVIPGGKTTAKTSPKLPTFPTRVLENLNNPRTKTSNFVERRNGDYRREGSYDRFYPGYGGPGYGGGGNPEGDEYGDGMNPPNNNMNMGAGGPPSRFERYDPRRHDKEGKTYNHVEQSYRNQHPFTGNGNSDPQQQRPPPGPMNDGGDDIMRGYNNYREERQKYERYRPPPLQQPQGPSFERYNPNVHRANGESRNRPPKYDAGHNTLEHRNRDGNQQNNIDRGYESWDQPPNFNNNGGGPRGGRDEPRWQDNYNYRGNDANDNRRSALRSDNEMREDDYVNGRRTSRNNREWWSNNPSGPRGFGSDSRDMSGNYNMEGKNRKNSDADDQWRQETRVSNNSQRRSPSTRRPNANDNNSYGRPTGGNDSLNAYGRQQSGNPPDAYGRPTGGMQGPYGAGERRGDPNMGPPRGPYGNDPRETRFGSDPNNRGGPPPGPYGNDPNMNRGPPGPYGNDPNMNRGPPTMPYGNDPRARGPPPGPNGPQTGGPYGGNNDPNSMNRPRGGGSFGNSDPNSMNRGGLNDPDNMSMNRGSGGQHSVGRATGSTSGLGGTSSGLGGGASSGRSTTTGTGRGASNYDKTVQGYGSQQEYYGGEQNRRRGDAYDSRNPSSYAPSAVYAPSSNSNRGQPTSSNNRGQQQRSWTEPYRTGDRTNVFGTTTESGTRKLDGGNRQQWTFDKSVANVQLELWTEGLPIMATVELLEGGESQRKNSFEVYVEDGYTRPYSTVLDLNGYGGTILIRNDGPVEYPIMANVQPFNQGQQPPPQSSSGGGGYNGNNNNSGGGDYNTGGNNYNSGNNFNGNNFNSGGGNNRPNTNGGW